MSIRLAELSVTLLEFRSTQEKFGEHLLGEISSLKESVAGLTAEKNQRLGAMNIVKVFWGGAIVAISVVVTVVTHFFLRK